MSNIDSICVGLQSTRIKERNDSLILLEEVLSSPSLWSSISPKQYSYVISLIFKLIELEKKLYIKSSTTNLAIEQRLITAANAVKKIIENSVRIKETDPSQGRSKLKFKHYQVIFNEIKNLLPIDSSTLFWPCAFELIYIINISLRQNFVNEHLGNNDWVQMVRFIVRTIETVQDENVGGTGGGNADENISLELFQCLSNLLLADSPTSIHPLVLSDDKVYFLLLPIINKACMRMKKEGALTVTLLKIINKLIMVLSTEDLYFVNKLIIKGISLLVSFSGSKLVSLQLQMVIFLNLDGVHDFIDFSRLPKMNSIEAAGPDISIRSDSDSETDEFLKDFEIENQVSMDFKVLQYSIGVLIQSFFNSVGQTSFQLPNNGINLFTNFDHRKITWFNLKSIYLNNNTENSERVVISWLLNLGLAKLLETFFKLKRYAPSSHSSSSKTTPEPSRLKRQKLDIVQQVLQDSKSVVDFICKILNSKPVLEVQKSSLQLLVFYIQQQKEKELAQKSSNKELSESNYRNVQSSSSTAEKFASSSALDIETTILNIAFEVDSDGTEISHSKNFLIRTLLNSFDANNSYWFLLAYQSTVEDNIILSGVLSQRYYLQLFKLILPLINNSLSSNVSVLSCNLIHILIEKLDINLNNLVDSTLIVQLDNILELSEVKGPSFISKFSFKFWYSIYKIIKKTNLHKKFDIQVRIQEWALSKWDDIVHELNELKEFVELTEFLVWLFGVDISNLSYKRTFESPVDLYQGTLVELYQGVDKYYMLESFIMDQHKNDHYHKKENIKQFDIESLGSISGGKTEAMCLKILTYTNKYLQTVGSSTTISTKFIWTLFLCNLVLVTQGAQALQLFVNPIHLKCTQLIDFFADASFDALDVLPLFQIINQTNKSIIGDLFWLVVKKHNINAFSFSPFTIKSLMEVIKRDTVASRLPKDDGFEEDFALTTSSYSIESSKLLNVEYVVVLNFLLFLANDLKVAKHESIFICVLDMLDSLDDDSLLKTTMPLLSIESRLFNEVRPELLRRLMRMLGEGPLTSHELERSELTIVVISRLLSSLVPIFDKCMDEELNKDWLDMSNWLLLCGKKRLIRTEWTIIEQSRFLISSFHILKNYEDSFFENFHFSTNNMKISLVEQLEYIFNGEKSYFTIQRQMELYKKLFSSFEAPQQSIPSAATFCLFFASICRGQGIISFQIFVAAVFNLVEYARFSFFVPYIKYSIRAILCSYFDYFTPKDLFKLIRIDLLRYWWSYNKGIEDFPFELFEFNDLQALVELNFKEVTGFCLAIKGDRSFSENHLAKIAKFRMTDIQTITIDSFPLIISLAYTESGIKNEIHGVLKKILGKSYSEQFRLRLPLIILEILSFLEISNENLLVSMYPESHLIENLISLEESVMFEPIGTLISFRTGNELLKSLIGKYLNNEEDFWKDKRVVHFFIRRLALKLAHSKTIQSMHFNLRRIKFVVIKSHIQQKRIKSTPLIELLFETLCPLLNDSQIGNEICGVLSLCDIGHSAASIHLLVKVLNQLIRRTILDKSNKILTMLQLHIEASEESKRKVILLAVIRKLQDVPFICSRNDIESFMNSKVEFEICRINGDFEDITFLMSYIFPKANLVINKAEEIVVSHISEIRGESFYGELAPSFIEWCGRYIAEFYFSGNAEIKCYSAISQDDPVIYTRKFDNLLKLALKLSTNNDIKANVEALIGVLLWKYDVSKSDVMKYVDLTEIVSKFLDYLLPIDFHSCVLLNSREDEMIIPIVSLKEITKTILGKTTFEDWTMQAFLVFITEISRYTSIAPLFSNLVVKVPSFASGAMPDLICIYLGLKGDEGSNEVVDIIYFLMSTVQDRKPGSTEEIKFSNLLIRIVSAIRLTSKQDEPVFKGVYSKLDFIKLSKIAALQNASTSLMYLEDKLSTGESEIDKNIETRKQELLNSETKTLQTIYESMSDEDMIHGLPIEPSLNFAINMLNKDISNIDQVKFSSSTYDAELTLSNNEDQNNTNLIHSMMKNGLMGFSKLVSWGNSNSEVIADESSYEWAWKLNCWDTPIPSNSLTENKMIYKTLKQIQDYPDNFESICNNSITEIFKNRDYLPDNENWMRSLASIVSISELTNCWHSGTDLVANLRSFDLKTAWIEEVNDLEAIESLLLSRRALLQVLTSSSSISSEKEEQSWLCSMNELIRYNNVTRHSDRYLQKSLNSTMLLNEISEKKFKNSDPVLQKFLKQVVKFQSACTLWSQGETTIPVAMLRDINNHAHIGSDTDFDLPDNLRVLTGVVNSLLVEWISASRQELPSTIMSQYINPTLERLIPGDKSGKIYERFARFCEKQLKARPLQDKLKKIGNLIESRKNEKEELKTHYNKRVVNHAERASIQRYYSKLKALYEQDIQEFEALEATKDELSEKAVQFYLKSIDTNFESVGRVNNSTSIDENVDKFFALWLEFSSKEFLNITIRDELLALPTHKLVNWCPQLISRISNDPTEFQKSLQLLILKICQTHPYHSLYNLISLTRHDSSAKFNPTSTIAAKNLWERLKNEPDNKPIINDIESFCDHAIKLAEVKAAKGKSFQLDKARGDLEFTWWLTELPAIPPPTLEIQVDLTLKYRNIPTFSKIDPKIEIATSGLSLPKIAKFILSDGSKHKMLLKHGADDLRQDSIMEQVFEKVNQMFWNDKETRKRKLRVRTYKAVPLGPQNGIIEFVPNSMALIDVIRPYHQTRDKMKVEMAREKMKKCQGESKAKRVAVYEEITKEKIQPVLRFFFLDNFTTPEKWFQSRILYTHGIASTSIVGYMLGLGDRHCNNILLDKETGEPIHIDLGVAFDQGKRLPIPETVPFRLTRDIVDGFGITGVEGTFRKSSEHSFRVLRNNKDHVLAILDVLRWDPLYSWSLSPLRKHKLQDDEIADQGYGILPPAQSHEDGSEAGRAINRVADKLVGEGLSIEATVRELIQESTSNENLAMIYCGWCPFF